MLDLITEGTFLDLITEGTLGFCNSIFQQKRMAKSTCLIKYRPIKALLFWEAIANRWKYLSMIKSITTLLSIEPFILTPPCLKLTFSNFKHSSFFPNSFFLYFKILLKISQIFKYQYEIKNMLTSREFRNMHYHFTRSSILFDIINIKMLKCRFFILIK